MKSNISSVFGQFGWKLSATVSDELIPVLVNYGLLQIAQRSPSTGAEKEICVRESLWGKDAEGKAIDKRPKGFVRGNIPFSEENAATLKKHLSELKVETGRNEKDEPIYAKIKTDVSIEQYFGSETESKWVKEKAKYVQRAAEGKASKLAEAVGYEGPLGDGTADGAPLDFLKAIRVWVNAQADKL